MSGQGGSYDNWIGLVVSALSGGVLTKLGEMLFGRKEREVSALSAAISSLSAQLGAADERMDAFGERLDACHDQHEECERGRREDRAEIDGLKTKIERLLSGDHALPAYHLNAPKGDPGRGEGR